MAKKSFTAGGTKTGILNSDGGENLKKFRQRHNTILNIFLKIKLYLTLKMKCIHRMALMHSKKVYLLTV